MENQFPLPIIRVLHKPNAKRVIVTLYKDAPMGVQQSHLGNKIAVFYSAGLAYDFALQMREYYRGYYSVEIA